MAEENVSPDPLQSVLKSLPPDQAKRVLESLGAEIRKAFKESLPEINEVFHNALKRDGHTEEVAGLVRLLAARSNDSKENAILKALTLYGLALDAREKGNRLAILNSDDEILHEVIGFDTVEEAHSKAAV